MKKGMKLVEKQQVTQGKEQSQKLENKNVEVDKSEKKQSKKI